MNPSLLPVPRGVHGRLGEEHLALGGVDVELVGPEGVVPDVAHVVPVAHHAVLHGVVDLEHGAQLGGLVADHQVLHLDVVDPVRSPVEVERNRWLIGFLDMDAFAKKLRLHIRQKSFLRCRDSEKFRIRQYPSRALKN